MSLAIISFIFLLCIGLLTYAISDFWVAQLVGISFFSAIAFLCLIPIAYLEVIRRPKEVLVGDPLILTYRTREPRKIALEDIEWVDVNRGNQSTLMGRINTGGRVMVKGETKSLFFTYDIASSIMEEYAIKYGRHPPSRP